MRKVNITLNDIIDQIKNLQGQNINLEVSRGRKKTEHYSGIIENVYPSIFTVRPHEDNLSLSFSFADVLCGVVNLQKEIDEPKQEINS